jgi:hypothetical protein
MLQVAPFGSSTLQSALQQTLNHEDSDKNPKEIITKFVTVFRLITVLELRN